MKNTRGVNSSTNRHVGLWIAELFFSFFLEAGEQSIQSYLMDTLILIFETVYCIEM